MINTKEAMYFFSRLILKFTLFCLSKHKHKQLKIVKDRHVKNTSGKKILNVWENFIESPKNKDLQNLK